MSARRVLGSRSRSAALGVGIALLGALLPAGTLAHARTLTDATPLAAARETEPVVLTGTSFPEWAVPADTTAKIPEADGKRCVEDIEGLPNPIHDPGACEHSRYEDAEVSSADATDAAGLTGAPVERLRAYRWTEQGFRQIPFQVDEMFVRYLSNDASGFSWFSETDQHTAYAFDREGFRWTEDCSTAKPDDPHCVGVPDELKPCVARPATPPAVDPVRGLDTDDEMVFMAKDAGPRALPDAPLPPGIADSYEVSVTDPLTGAVDYVYVMKASAEGPSPRFDASNGYVSYKRDAAVNGNLFLFSQSSYDDYGNAPKGPVYNPETGTCDLKSVQRRPSDGAWVTTPRYRFRYDGRWLMTKLEINNSDDGTSIAPSETDEYGQDLIDQWKARAFQQRPGGTTPCCGFEEEVNNWGGSSVLMGERSGPVRTIRETWGADSGTNVVRREIFYRDEIRFGAFLRVHVIPPADGIYSQWDYNAGIATRYYNSVLSASNRANGVAIDGKTDEVFGNDRVKVGSDGIAYNGQGIGETSGCPNDACIDNDIDSPDPTFSGANAGLNWEQVSGPFGTIVTRTALKQVTPGGAAQSIAAVPYYRDDSCFDDGTGSDPGPHLNPRAVDDGEFAKLPDGSDRVCWDTDNPNHPDIPGADPRFFQGSIGTHGVHILLIADSDNAGTTLPVTEIDSEQRMVVLPGDPGNVGERYGRHSEKPLVVEAHPENRPTPAPPVTTNAGCDPLDPAACLLPFPNDLFTVADASTDTGRRVNFDPLAMPRTGTELTDGGEGKPIDPTEWNRNDGFSPGSMVMTYVPDLDLDKTWGTEDRPHRGQPNDPNYFDHRDHITDIGLYQNADAPMVIINTDTGERHPFWSELDTHPDAVAAGEQILLMRPAVNFEENTRYVVGLRNLRAGDGSVIEAGSAFAAYRDRSGADAQRQRHFEEQIFPVLEAGGIAREDLYLAWDFTVASERNLAERILHMRNQAFAGLNDTTMGDRRIQGNAPAFTIDATSEFDDSWQDSRGVTHTRRYRRIEGRVTVPNFMDRIQQTESKVKGTGEMPGESIQYDVPAPGSRLFDVNRDGLPEQNPVEPTVNVYFRCELPLNGEQNIPGLYGHGLLGQARDQIQDFRRSPGRMTSMFGCAMDWWGMSTQDLPTVLAATTDMSHFPTIPDRAQQGFLNFMFLGRAAAHPEGFATHEAFQQEGESLVKTSPIDEETQLVYDGNSQGGIMGGSLVAVSPDINRGILGVPGMNYSTLLNRSVDFEGEFQLEPDIPPYSFPVYQSYRDVVERQLVFGLMQMLWDRGEANGYAHHMTDDPLPNTPEHDVMLQVAWSDHQVANVSAEVEARTIGAPIMKGLEEHWSFDRDPGVPGVQNPFYAPADYPHTGSGLVYWDSGNAIPPNGNIPPVHNGDPHNHSRSEPAAGWQEAHYLLTGDLVDVCGGGDYLTRRHPRNGGRGDSPPSCHPPNVPPGTDLPGPTPTPTTTASTGPTASPTEHAPIATEVSFVDTASSGQYSDDATFQARLTQSDGVPVPGQTLRFELTTAEGTRTFTDETDQDGLASVVATLTERPGPADLRVFYDGSDTHDPDADWMSFAVMKEDTSLALDVTGNGSKRALIATLTDADSGTGIEGRVIEFSADSEPICRPGPATDAQGSASCDPPSRYQGGRRTYAADFREDDYYVTASAQRST